MGNFKHNPREPLEVKVPNSVRKRITMHEKESTELGVSALERLLQPLVVATKQRGSMWSRFTDQVKKFLR